MLGRQHLIDTSDIAIAGSDITPIDYVKLLCVNLDSTLSIKTLVSRTVSSGFYNLHQIKDVRGHLTLDAPKTLLNFFTVSRLDYCNSIFAGVPSYQLYRLQWVFNASARLICGVQRKAHITQVHRDELYSLKCPQRYLTVCKVLMDWNRLRVDVRQWNSYEIFKIKLKIFLFRSHNVKLPSDAVTF